ncbi:MAG: hypothetical protein JST79_11545 [Acidobacteria bacterium]|nr:hypothetical protein [Acidobacteriota bacterium]
MSEETISKAGSRADFATGKPSPQSGLLEEAPVLAELAGVGQDASCEFAHLLTILATEGEPA